MTLEQARGWAIKDSLNGYVQHVCKASDGTYYVSDWYSNATVESYENGRRID